MPFKQAQYLKQFYFISFAPAKICSSFKHMFYFTCMINEKAYEKEDLTFLFS